MQDISFTTTSGDELSSLMNQSAISSQLGSPRSQISSISRKINPNTLKIADKPNLNQRSFKRVLTSHNNLLQKTNNSTICLNHREKGKDNKNQNQQMDELRRKNQQLLTKDRMLTEQNKYLMKQNEQLKKKLQAFNNIQVRIQNLQALNVVLQQRLKEKEEQK